MSRILTLSVVLLLAIAAFLMIRNFNHRAESNTSTFESGGSVAAQTQQVGEEWREFISSSGHFKVMLPSLPQHVSDRITDPKTQEMRKYETFIAANDDGEAFMISAITFAHNVEEEVGGESLKAVVNDMLARNTANKLNSMNPGTLHALITYDFSISSGDRRIEGKVLAKGKTVYLLSMINQTDRFNPQDFNKFVNSFETTPD